MFFYSQPQHRPMSFGAPDYASALGALLGTYPQQPVQQSPLDVLLGRQQAQEQFLVQQLLQTRQEQAVLQTLLHQAQQQAALNALVQQQIQLNNLNLNLLLSGLQSGQQSANLLAALQAQAMPQPEMTHVLHRLQAPAPAPVAENNLQAVFQTLVAAQQQQPQPLSAPAPTVVRRPHVRPQHGSGSSAPAPIKKCCGTQQAKPTVNLPSQKYDLQAFLHNIISAATQVPSPGSAAPVPKASTSKASDLSLKEQLEARLYSDESTEIQDTIRAIMASLGDKPTAPVAPTSSSSSSDKGKAKAPPKDSVPADGLPVPELNVVESLAIIRSIDDASKVLSDTFVFPSQLDFSTPSSPSASSFDGSQVSTTKLAFTAPNHSVKAYEQGLTSLLLQLDTIDSYGDENVRHERKEVVARIEKALEDLESEVDGRRLSWERKQRKLEDAEKTLKEETVLEESQVTIKPYDVSEPVEVQPESAPAGVPEPPAYDTDESVVVAEPHTLIEDNEASIAVVHAHPSEIEPEVTEPSEEPELIDTFLQPAAAVDEPVEKRKSKQQNDDVDVGSDWSEVDA